MTIRLPSFRAIAAIAAIISRTIFLSRRPDAPVQMALPPPPREARVSRVLLRCARTSLIHAARGYRRPAASRGAWQAVAAPPLGR
jgi:hypothetical protein